MQTFYQPVDSHQQSRLEYQDDTSNPANNPEEDTETEDEDGGKEMVEEHLQRLSLKARYRALGKFFTLKFWPWPAPTWWVIDASQTSKAGDLDIKIHRQFTLFVEIEMAMFAEEWLCPTFIQEVFFSHSDMTLLLTLIAVSEWGTRAPI